jgi:hypothetical protein
LPPLYELWGPWPHAGDVGAPRGTLARLVIGLRFPLLVLALAGLCLGRRRIETWMVAAPLIAGTAIHIAFFSASPRFTVPMEPSAIVLGALAVPPPRHAAGDDPPQSPPGPRVPRASPDRIAPSTMPCDSVALSVLAQRSRPTGWRNADP